jgi:hypothetical protein
MSVTLPLARGGQPFIASLILGEARLICKSQDLILHVVLSDEIATVRQSLR